MAVTDFYKGKNIFITGGTGFLGQALIEKLLRSCSDVGNIYILLRPKREDSIRQRLEKLKVSAVFDVVRQQNPQALDKLIPISGDCSEINLGLNEKDRKLLIDNVNIIFHSAASVRFDDFLKAAIILNVRGTREVAKLALDLKHISVFVHISTIYSNCDRYLIEEKLYPSHGDWKEAITLAEECDEEIIHVLSEKYIRPMPNTYTYAKSLGEQVVNDMCNGKIPTIITRPSVVISARDEPLKGWNVNFNGPVGLILAGAKGVLRTTYGKKDTVIDYLPVDFVIKATLLAVLEYTQKRTKELEIYNMSQNRISKITQEELIVLGRKICEHDPFLKVLWYPSFSITECWYSFYFSTLLFHLLPALFFDTLLRLSKQKPMIFKIQRKIYIANNVLAPFAQNSYCLPNDKIVKTRANLKPEDSAFNYPMVYHTEADSFNYFSNAKRGVSRYVLKDEPEYTVDEAKKVHYKLWLAHIALKTVMYGLLLWLLFCKVDIINVVYNGARNYFNSLD